MAMVKRHNPRITKWPAFKKAATRRGYKQSTKTGRRRVSAAWRKYKNDGAFGIPLDSILPMRKSAARARRAAAKKPKTTRKRKLNAYARFLKKVGGKGHIALARDQADTGRGVGGADCIQSGQCG